MKQLYLTCKKEWFKLSLHKQDNIKEKLIYFVRQMSSDSNVIQSAKFISAFTTSKEFPFELHYHEKDMFNKLSTEPQQPIIIKSLDALTTHILYISDGYWYLIEKVTDTKSEDFIKKENSKFKF